MRHLTFLTNCNRFLCRHTSSENCC